MSKHYKTEIGTAVILDTEVDISQGTAFNIAVIKPDGTAVTWAGTLVSTTKVQHILVTGDFDQSGLYKLQAYVTIGAQQKFYGETVEIYVYELGE